MVFCRGCCGFSDCSNVVNTAHFLGSHGLDPQCLGRLDHKYLWTKFCNVAKNRLGSFVVYKVKSHVSKSYHSQDPFLSINNDHVDVIAKDEARRIRNLFCTDAIKDLKTSMALHAHQVATLKLRGSEFCLLPVQEPPDFFCSLLFSSPICSGPPLGCVRAKRSTC